MGQRLIAPDSKARARYSDSRADAGGHTASRNLSRLPSASGRADASGASTPLPGQTHKRTHHALLHDHTRILCCNGLSRAAIYNHCRYLSTHTPCRDLGSHCMESFVYGSLAQIRILLLPVGNIRRATFERWAQDIRSFDTIRLGDITTDVKDERCK